MLATDSLATSPDVLLVEDDDDIRRGMRQLLEDEGYRVITAHHGEEAIALLHTQPPPKLALVDLHMPVMDGWTLVARLRSESKLANIPVIVVSVNPHTPRDVVAYVKKPIDTQFLLELVRKHCK